ncbi:MAG: hypothetical protein CSB23_04235 [Deltaproteobacteria bacterium]|nr:MAG: hypothetical protein CSB23_04235 [Deltaproteobacteria bacterium]
MKEQDMEETVQTEKGDPGRAGVEAPEGGAATSETVPQQAMLEQLAAELVATRQELAAVQQQLALERAATQAKLAEEQAMAQQRYSQMVQSVEEFVQGNGTVGDVVKTVASNVTQGDSLWKGALVGAAAAILLTSTPVRDAMGKSFNGLFPGLQKDSEEAAKQ